MFCSSSSVNLKHVRQLRQLWTIDWRFKSLVSRGGGVLLAAAPATTTTTITTPTLCGDNKKTTRKSTASGHSDLSHSSVPFGSSSPPGLVQSGPVLTRICSDVLGIAEKAQKVIYLFSICLDDEQTSQVMGPSTLRWMASALATASLTLVQCNWVWGWAERELREIWICSVTGTGLVAATKYSAIQQVFFGEGLNFNFILIENLLKVVRFIFIVGLLIL